MLSHAVAVIALSLVVGLGISAVVLSIVILCRGKLYHHLSPEARPRRYVLISMLALFAVFVIWFPAWMAWANALVSRLLLGLFAVALGVVGLTSRFTWLVDGYFKRKGWPLR